MREAYLIITFFGIALMLIIYGYSKPMCFGLILPMRAIINQMVNVKLLNVFGIDLNAGDLFGIFTITICTFFLLTNFGKVFLANRNRVLNWCILWFLIWTLLSAMLSYDRMAQVKNWAKVSSWMLLVPVCTVVFDNLRAISKLRSLSIISLLITLGSVLFTNVKGIGPVAYGGGGNYPGTGFHLGYYLSESALSLALTMALPTLFLPYLTKKGPTARIRFSTIAIGLGVAFCVTSIFLRAALLSVLLFMVIFMIFCRKNDITGMTFLKKIILVFMVLIIVGIYLLKHPEIVHDRLRDAVEFIATGERKQLGSGRIMLISLYFRQWESRGWAYKLFGIDTGVAGGQEIQYNLRAGAHNDIMAILFRSGIIGLSLYFLIILQIALRVMQKLRSKSDEISHHLGALGLSVLAIYSVFIVHGALEEILAMSYFALTMGSMIAYAEEGHKRYERSGSHQMEIP